ncbi:hypothetical protein [Rhodopseudomonas sp. AAP120]|uniref:hypothetical protein n=1 Tax=Rhodopseudomonas sp. AAP120 TaxID=1523430 RepID=UPI000A69C59F|nr:hypothetical protein [Rhodopseudomonas sp. AAP120]
MSRSGRIAEILKTGGFSFHYLVGRWTKLGFSGQCCALAACAAIAIIIAAALDHTFVLPGRDVGLLQHPAIWAFIALQIALPLSIRTSLNRVGTDRTVGLGGLPDQDFAEELQDQLIRWIRLEGSLSLTTASLFHTAGFAAFAWNSYQNQLPGILLSYDFWDSSNHFWGYWITRIYKFYLFVWLLPYIAFVHAGVLAAALDVIRKRRLAGKLVMQPFHHDSVGGLGFVPGLVTTPIVVTLLISSVPVGAAFSVHRALDVTPLMGASIVVVGALLAYAIPIFRLRTDIIAMKRVVIEKIRLLQQNYYSRIVSDEKIQIETLRQGNEALDYFEKICTKIEKISNYPHLIRLLKYLGLAMTPSFLSLGIKLYDKLSPTLLPLLKLS